MGKKQPRGLTPVREPSGRLSRASAAAVDAVSPAEAKRLMVAALAGVQAQEWGTEIGRLFLAAKVDQYEFEAGKRWGRLVVAYHQSIGARPPYPKAMIFNRVDPSPEPDPDSEAGKRRTKDAKNIIADMREAHGVLIGAGKLAEHAVRSVCESNESPVGVVGLENLQKGLNWLASHWGLVPQTRKAYGR